MRNMAVALSAPILAAGRRVLALFKSAFFLVFDALRQTFRRAWGIFSPISSPSKNPGQTDLGPSTTAVTTSDSPPAKPATSQPAPPNTQDGEASGEDREGDTTMAAISSSSTAPPPRKLPIPNIIPALPRLSLLSKRENTMARPVTTPSANATAASSADSDTELRNGAARLCLDGYVPSTVACPVVIDATRFRPARGQDAESPNGESSRVLPLSDSTNSAAQEVTRAPPVPMVHDVSQTSKLKDTATIKPSEDTVRIQAKKETPEQAAERAIHSGFMREALDMARLALKTNETPVGCVLVYKNRVIARGMNATNVSRNGTRHAELMAICALLSYSPASDLEAPKNDSGTKAMPLGDKTNQSKVSPETSAWGDVDPRDGHLFPYGQKLHPAPRVNRSVITECTLYVTVEPCVMCASLLRQLGIKKVFFGAVNDKFGGTGGVFRIHKNSPYSTVSAPPSPAPQNGKGPERPALPPRPYSINVTMDGQISSGDDRSDDNIDVPVEPVLPGDGGNVEPGYEVEGGWGRDEAVTLLRQFYVQENGRAPVPRKKEGRAARLAAMMERDGHAGGPMIEATALLRLQENGTETPREQPTSPMTEEPPVSPQS